jgi:hypothetical protein
MTPMSEEEVRRCAALWRRRLGGRAAAAAQAMVETLTARGDAAQADEWRRIIAVLQERPW